MVLVNTSPTSVASSRALRSATTFALVATLLLRIAVPVGLMPAEDGWFLKICPDGLPARVAAIFGDEHAHHHEDSSESFQQCDLSGVSSHDVVSSTTTLSAPEIVTTSVLTTRLTLTLYQHSSWQRPPVRGPPPISRLT